MYFVHSLTDDQVKQKCQYSRCIRLYINENDSEFENSDDFQDKLEDIHLTTDPQPVINDFINEIKTTDSRIVVVLVVRVQKHMEIYQSMLYAIRNQTFVNG